MTPAAVRGAPTATRLPWLTRLCLALLHTALLLAPLLAHGANLSVTLDGTADREIARNIHAWLGPLPDTEQARLSFVSAARERVANSLEALGYYRPDIEVDLDRREREWRLHITVEPGQPVRLRAIEIRLEGDAASDPAFIALRDDPGVKAGDALHHDRYRDLRRRLLSLAQERGYFDSRLTTARVAVDADAGTADIDLALASGPRYRFGELRYDAELADPDMLSQLAGFRAGDPYDQTQLRELQDRVRRTGFYTTVVAAPLLEDAADGMVPIELELVRVPRHSFDVGVGYSTDTQERLSLTWRTPHINRYGHSQVTRVEYSSINPSGRFTYNIPLTDPLNDLLQLWARTEDNEYGDSESRQDELGARREIRAGNWVYGYSLRGLEESWDVLEDRHTADALLLGGTVASRYYTGSLVDPASGFHQLYTLEGSSEELNSDIDLVRFTARLRQVLTVAPRHRLVGRADFGVAEVIDGARADLAPSLAFFAGGSQSIRGFSYQSLGNEITVVRPDGERKTVVVGGDRLAVGSLEYQYYFTERWRGALFADGGDAFDQGEFDWNYGAGFGVHYVTPVGAVRVDFANSLSEDHPDWYFHLTVGAEF